MTDESNDALRKTVEAQAERIRALERQLEAKSTALDIALRTLARQRAQPRQAPNIAPAPEQLPWRTRLRGAAVIFGGKLLPRRVKRFVKKFWDPWAPVRRHPKKKHRRADETFSPATASYDVVCFAIIDWSFRWQRPQQLLSQFADAGHRVFVFKTSEFLRPGPPWFEVAKLRENVWEVTLAPPKPIDVYSGAIDPEVVAWFPTMLDALRRELNIVGAVSLVQVATWHAVAEDARRRFGWKLVYDCMDEWSSFPGMKAAMVETEAQLVAEADLVTVSGDRLVEKWRGLNPRVELIRNASDFAFFSATPAERFLGEVKRPIAGYFGAIASWFDVELMARVASQRPEVSFVLIGGVFDVDVRPLGALPNVHLLGQQPYARMPAYLRDFDVCLIPFVVSEVTAATDPVKFYEYISLGKPVVSTSMPELEQFRGLYHAAADADDFARGLDAALAETDEGLRARRIEVARENAWPARAARMLGAIRDAHPRVSVIIVSYDNRELTRTCVESVLAHSTYPNIEVLVVDNGSMDGSAEMLEALRDDRVRLLLNHGNAGFAAANNQALRVATGSYLILLNNDTVVPRGWVSRMLRHLEDPRIGLAVAVTNFSGNESRIQVPYDTLEEMLPFAERYMREHEAQRFDIRVAAMYCVGMRRDVYESIGPLDEEYAIGMFEDDDYSHRVRLGGFRVVCAEDVFVHHVGQAAFSKLDRETYEELWKRNQRYFESKWGVRWEPHRMR
jgi:GT2 family glycosyltransferase/glycosyltransferase involved in cell wall biosynthesis